MYLQSTTCAYVSVSLSQCVPVMTLMRLSQDLVAAGLTLFCFILHHGAHTHGRTLILTLMLTLPHPHPHPRPRPPPGAAISDSTGSDVWCGWSGLLADMDAGLGDLRGSTRRHRSSTGWLTDRRA